MSIKHITVIDIAKYLLSIIISVTILTMIVINIIYSQAIIFIGYCISYNEMLKHVNNNDNVIKMMKKYTLYYNDHINNSEYYNNIYTWLIYWVMTKFKRHKSISFNSYTDFLSSHPPIRPVKATDLVFKVEKTDLFIFMVFIISKNVEYDEFVSKFYQRWVKYSYKFKCIIRYVYGRLCWVNTCDEFDIHHHICEVTPNVDENLTDSVIRCVNSKIDDKLPQWLVHFVKFDNHTKVILKLHHTYSDGSSLMYNIVSKLGDNPVSLAELPDNYKIKIPKYKQILYYSYNGLKASLLGLSILLDWKNNYNTKRTLIAKKEYEYDSTSKGKRYISKPIVLNLDMVRKLKAKISTELSKNSYKKYNITINDILLFATLTVYSKIQEDNNEGILTQYIIENARNSINNNIKRRKIVIAHDSNKENASPNSNTRVSTNNDKTKLYQYEDQMQYNKTNSFSNSGKQLDSDYLRCSLQISSNTKKYNIIIPYMCRTEIPTIFNNETSMVCLKCHIPIALNHKNFSRDNYKRLILRSIWQFKNDMKELKKNNIGMIVYMIFCALAAALPFSLFSLIYRSVYKNMQFCSTNVAAPSIQSTFCGEAVDQLIFWPAVHEMCSIGTSWVSLGNQIEILSVVSEVETKNFSKLLNNLQCQNKTLKENMEYKRIKKAELPTIIVKLIKNELMHLADTFGTI